VGSGVGSRDEPFIDEDGPSRAALIEYIWECASCLGLQGVRMRRFETKSLFGFNKISLCRVEQGSMTGRPRVRGVDVEGTSMAIGSGRERVIRDRREEVGPKAKRKVAFRFRMCPK